MAQHDQPTGPQPETLDSHGGSRLARSRGPRRTGLWVAGGLAVVAAGAAGWAAWSFFSTGAQPAEALPASTLAYASIDLDPSGGQKIEALRTLRKFPAFRDHVGLETTDDVRRWIVDQIAEDSGCDLDYGSDVEPWLGDRFAVAALDAGGSTPSPVLVLQVSDEGAADRGLAALRDCAGGSAGDVAWTVSDGWALVGESREVVSGAADDAADASLADDEDFQHWTGEAGDSGIVSLYAAPGAGGALARSLDPFTLAASGSGGALPTALADFAGAAATLRFADGGLELEVAADAGAAGTGVTSGDSAGAAVSSLPADTVAALGVSFGDGWVSDLVDRFGSGGGSAEDQMAAIGRDLGIDLPEDAETVVGDSLALSVDADFDPSALFYGSPGGDASADITGVGVKILGDASDIEGVLDKLRTAAAGEDGGVLDSDVRDGAVAVGPDADYRARLLQDGGLGDSDPFGRVVEHADDAGAILYVDFDAGDGWLADLAGDDRETQQNLDPLGALGLSTWRDGDTAHGVVRVTTD